MEILNIRSLSLKDGIAFCQFREIASRESEYVNNMSLTTYNRMLVESQRSNTHYELFGAFASPKLIVGEVVTCVAKKPSATILHINSIAVLAVVKGRGVAEKLFRHAISRGRIHHCSVLELVVHDKNERAIAFYEKMGMTRLKRYHYGDDNEVYTMSI